jgi:hypothetical protein
MYLIDLNVEERTALMLILIVYRVSVDWIHLVM